MKQTLWILGIVGMVMTSCTETDVLNEASEIQTSKIVFENHVGKSTRAVENDNFNFFEVYGTYVPSTSTNRIVIFNGETVEKKDGKWGYSDTHYWVEGGVYNFYAYSDDNAVLHNEKAGAYLGSGTGILNISEYVADHNNQHDLVFAKSGAITGKPKGQNESVKFTFTHILSRIFVTFKSGFPAGYNVKISNVKVTGIHNKGDYTANTLEVGHTWTASSDNTNAYVEPKVPAQNVATAANGAEEAVDVVTDFAYVIPCDYGENKRVAIEFNIDVTRGEDEILGKTIKVNWAPKWIAGHTYKYNVTINGTAADLDPIEFDVVEITNWVDGDPTLPDISVE